MVTCKRNLPNGSVTTELNGPPTRRDHIVCPSHNDGHRTQPIRFIRLKEVIKISGLGETKIYELQAQGRFPMRVQITAHSVGWIEEEVQAWLTARINASTALSIRSPDELKYSRPGRAE
jgi:prophage regulatory protein